MVALFKSVFSPSQYYYCPSQPMTGLAFLDRPIRVQDSLKPFSPPRTKNPTFHPRPTRQKTYSISNWEMCALGRFARNWRGRRRQGPGCHLAGEVVTVKGRDGCHLAGEVDTACHLPSLESPASLAKGPNERHIEVFISNIQLRVST